MAICCVSLILPHVKHGAGLLRRTAKYTSLLRTSGALHLALFEQPGKVTSPSACLSDHGTRRLAILLAEVSPAGNHLPIDQELDHFALIFAFTTFKSPGRTGFPGQFTSFE